MRAEPYRECVRCVMDTSDPAIAFDATGVCSHCHAYDRARQQPHPRPLVRGTLEEVSARIRRDGRRRAYDCVVGLSGGADSSYAALLAVRAGLRPLAVHLDNSWDSEGSVRNIERLLAGLGLDLYTHVIDWHEFRDLQRAFLRAGVIDLEMLSDHAITAITYHVARALRIRWVISGENTATESVLPRAWIHTKSDLRNIRAVHRAFGERDVRTFPTASTLRLWWWRSTRLVRRVHVLDLIPYDKTLAQAELARDFGWQDPGGKHWESLMTRFYQRYILPTRFGVDKRRAHLSSLVLAGQLSREDAVQRLAEPLYDPLELRSERAYFCKKLALTEAELDELMRAPVRQHTDFASEEAYLRPARLIMAAVRRTASRSR